MKVRRFEEFNIHEFGNSLLIGGVVVTGKSETSKGPIILMFPNESTPMLDSTYIDMSTEEFKKFLRQTDLKEVELFQNDGDKIVKSVVRKTQRQLDQNVSWEVFKRDEYTCRYCGRDGIPMSYDHIHLWENGGENTVQNGTCACRKCNKTRGNMDYADWLNSDYYKRVSRNVAPKFIEMNNELLKIYKTFPNRVSGRKR